MAINRNMQLNQFDTTRLRDMFAYAGHAAPFCLDIFGKKMDASVGFCVAPLFIGEGGLSVPISRGSPPTSD